MKHVSLFNDFLADTVNLNKTRIDQLEDSVTAIKNFVKASAWEPKIREFVEQGSWAHGTIIKPLDGYPFDADLMVYVRPVSGWDAKQYLNELYSVFANHGTYSDKVRRFSHCVTIEYAGERKIDVAPVVVERQGFITSEVCNRATNTFEQTRPKKYTAWLIERNGWTGRNSFRKVTRLLKYLRDIKTTFTCPSVLLTTLLGNQIYSGDKGSDSFSDAPTALLTLITRLDAWLQMHPSKPSVLNPTLASESFGDMWDDSQYKNFRDFIHKYASWIKEAFDEQDHEESLAKWQRIFGDQFGKTSVVKESGEIRSGVLTEHKALAKSASPVDLVDQIIRFGRSFLPQGMSRIPYKREPIWPKAAIAFETSIVATLHAERNGPSLGDVSSLDLVKKKRWLKFKAVSNGAALPFNYDVSWRITNTDKDAILADCLRGGFYDSDVDEARWEQTAYRGVHTVEAFVINRTTGTLVSVSEPFYVMVS